MSEFDVATAALEHLELLNQSNQNPLEIAAQFRTLLRSKKDKKNDLDDTYITTNPTIRNQGCSDNLVNHQSQTLSRLHSSCSLLKCGNESSDCFHYPTINWKQLRKKRYEYKLEQFLSTKFKPKDLTLSSLTTVSDITELQNNFEEMDSRSRSSTPSIRTPSISPIHFPQGTYTISRLNSTSINNDDIFFPIADCNLIIRHKSKRISYREDFCNNSTNKTMYI